MKRMFTDDAEFGNLINSNERLHISKVIHKSLIEVDEEGSKAASATAGKLVLLVFFNFNSTIFFTTF